MVRKQATDEEQNKEFVQFPYKKKRVKIHSELLTKSEGNEPTVMCTLLNTCVTIFRNMLVTCYMHLRFGKFLIGKELTWTNACLLVLIINLTIFYNSIIVSYSDPLSAFAM